MPSQLTFDDVDAAVRNGSVEAIFTELLKGAAPSGKNLSKLGFDTNAVDPDDGNTLMHVACGTGNLESARYLRKVGSDVNRFNDVGYTPLCCCILKAKSMGVNNGMWARSVCVCCRAFVTRPS
jgi:ankyrin repeat protein